MRVETILKTLPKKLLFKLYISCTEDCIKPIMLYIMRVCYMKYKTLNFGLTYVWP